MASNVFGIDLGTSNIKIYSKNDDNIVIEKNMIAIENRKALFAYGDSAFDMYEKAPANIQVSYPLNCGVIADIKNMENLVKLFITDMQRGRLSAADYVIAVPTDITEVEKRAFFDLIRDAGVKAKKIMVVEKAVADCLGNDVDVKNSQGVIVVNVGFDTTEISILSMGGIVISRLLKVGGRKFDDAIRNAVRKEYGLLIGSKTAESIKFSMSELEKKDMDAVVYGRDIVSGLPVERAIPCKVVNECLEDHISTIVENVRVILERTPPELGADIYRNGIYLSGGSSQIGHLAEKLSEGTKLKVNISENPITSVALGLAKIITEDKYKKLAYAIEGMRK